MDKGVKAWAAKIDEGICTLMTAAIQESLENVSPGYGEKFKADIKLIIELGYYIFLRKDESTPGMSLMKLDSTSKNRNKIAVVVYMITLWSVNKLSYFSMLQDWRSSRNIKLQKAYIIIKYLEYLRKCIELFHSLWFLWFGDYPSLIYRILGDNMSIRKDILDSSNHNNTQSNTQSNIGLNNIQISVKERQIFLSYFLAALSATATAIDTQSMKRLFFHLYQKGLKKIQDTYVPTMTQALSNIPYINKWSQKVSNGNNSNISIIDHSSPSSSSSSSFNNHNHKNNNKHGTKHISMNCDFCHSNCPEMSYQASCGHVFCYLCLISHIYTTAEIRRHINCNEDMNNLIQCPTCKQSITITNRWYGIS